MRIFRIASNLWTAVDLWKISGNASGITSRERITGSVEIVPDPRGRNAALVLLPISWLTDQNEEHRKRGIREYDPGSNLAFSSRTILPLSKKEAEKAFLAKSGDELRLKRSFFGESHEHILRKA